MKNLLLIMVLPVLLVAGIAAAEETGTLIEVEEVSIDEDVTAEDLGIGDPKILPDSNFYFFKNWARGIQSFFTFDNTEKAELKLRFANERLIEAKKMAEENKNPEALKNALRSYQDELSQIEETAKKIKGKAEENNRVGQFLDKYTQQQTLHYKILQKLEGQVPEDVQERIKATREAHLEKFGEVMNKLEEKNQEKIQERLEKNLDKVKGSEFKEMKSMEMLKGLENKSPKETKEAAKKAKEAIMEKFQEKINQLPEEKMERFQNYLENINGNEAVRLQIMETLRTKLQSEDAQESINRVRQRIMQEADKNENCIQVITPAIGPDGDCKEFPTPCDVPENWEKVDACIQANEPQAPECSMKWWYDGKSASCQEKSFCGAYMYQGLKTFDTKTECENSFDEKKKADLEEKIQGIQNQLQELSQ